jgi:hypothetical protein
MHKIFKVVGPMLVAMALVLAPVAAFADPIGVTFNVTAGGVSWSLVPQTTATLVQPWAQATGPWLTLSDWKVFDNSGTITHAHKIQLSTATLPTNAHLLTSSGSFTGTCLKVAAAGGGACAGSGALVRSWIGTSEVTSTPATFAGWSVGTVVEPVEYTYSGIGIVSASPLMVIGSFNSGVLNVVLTSGPP